MGGREAVVNLLLENGPNFEAKGKYDRTPLSCAVDKGREAIVKLLLNKDADMEIRAEYDLIVLEFEMEMRQKAVVNLLDIRTAYDMDYGLRPLSMAVGNGHEAMVKLLLQKEAMVNSKNSYDQIPLYFVLKFITYFRHTLRYPGR
jgi:ankyrin repeat protein